MKKEINVVLGQRVKFLRVSKGYTRESFAEMIDVSARFLADLERGNVGVSISTLKEIAKNLNVSSDYLIGLSENDSENIERDTAIAKIMHISNGNLKQVNAILDNIIELTKKE